MGKLSVDQVKFVQTLADLSFGTGKGEGVLGGKGNMGLLYDAGGKMHVVKCNTHFSQAGKMQKAIDAAPLFDKKYEGIIKASDDLRDELVKIARTAGMDDEAIKTSLGDIKPFKQLLTRKVVAGFVTTLKNYVAKEAPQDDTVKSGSLDGVWENVHATKSAREMSFQSVRTSGVEGHNATVFTAEQLELRKARDFFSKQARIDFGGCKYSALGNLAARLEKTLGLSLNGEETPRGDLELALHYGEKFKQHGLAWMLEEGSSLYYKVTRDALRDKFEGLDSEHLQNRVIDYNFCSRMLGRTLNAKLEEMLSNGGTYEGFLKDNLKSIGTGAFYQTPMDGHVRNAIQAKGFKTLDKHLKNYIAHGVWREIENDASDPLQRMLDNGKPMFSDIVGKAFGNIKMPLSDDEAGAPLESIRNALGNRIVDLNKQQADILALNIWKGGLSEKFGENFKNMMQDGTPTFAELVNEVADANLENLKQSGSSMWDELESCLSGNASMPEETKMAVRDTLIRIRELVAKKDDIVAGIKEKFEKLKEQCEISKTPAPDWKTFLGNGAALNEIFDACGVRNKWAWHVTQNNTDTLLSMFEAFANFKVMYDEAKTKDAVDGLLAALTDTGCAQARLDALQSFMATLDGPVGLSPVKCEPGDTPQSAILREVEYAAQAVRTERKISDKDPIAFSLVEDRLKSTINGKAFGNVVWSRHNVYDYLARQGKELEERFHITFTDKEKADFQAVLNKDHLSAWN